MTDEEMDAEIVRMVGWLAIVRPAIVEEFGPVLGNRYMDDCEDSVDDDVILNMSISDFVADVDVYLEYDLE